MKVIDEGLAGVTYKQAADLIEKHFDPKYGETFIDEALLLAIELLREADSPKDEVTENESVEAEKWHDIRKNPDDLPDTDREVICTIDGEVWMICRYAAEYKVWEVLFDFSGDYWVIVKGTVEAWREKPEPYKGE